MNRILLACLSLVLCVPLPTAQAHDGVAAAVAAGVAYTTELVVAHDGGSGRDLEVKVDVSQLTLAGVVNLRMVPPFGITASPASIANASRTATHSFTFSLAAPSTEELCSVGLGMLIVEVVTDPEDGATSMRLPLRILHARNRAGSAYHCTSS